MPNFKFMAHVQIDGFAILEGSAADEEAARKIIKENPLYFMEKEGFFKSIMDAELRVKGKIVGKYENIPGLEIGDKDLNGEMILGLLQVLKKARPYLTCVELFNLYKQAQDEEKGSDNES